jgi:hypothetical protein
MAENLTDEPDENQLAYRIVRDATRDEDDERDLAEEEKAKPDDADEAR